MAKEDKKLKKSRVKSEVTEFTRTLGVPAGSTVAIVEQLDRIAEALERIADAQEAQP